ncbi:hypothetical protein BFP70_05070 [Thioclava sp. SK-1]|uniref:rhomboid family intramembrane serine protease n=1 Tax=Thioclava sp. SK-1 TaxID=1889770 RepID=UPI0008268844|nr:rhomboid family intramembrane serine protease [Thioclava sp. SK-1]OCX66397.1 hypothetical protein BFP70_05070 [Thioclava sp. SK-1]
MIVSLRLPAVLVGLIILCLLPEAWLFVSGNGGYLRGRMYQNFAFWPGLLRGWQENYPGQRFAMFLTYGFCHAGLSHLGFNLLTLISLGRPLVEILGQWRFGLVYLAGLLGGAAGYALLSRGTQPMVGASGALFGMAGAVLWLRLIDAWHEDSFLSGLKGLIWPLLLLIGINVVMYWTLDGQLAWETHLGGFLCGGLSMALGRFGAVSRPRGEE